MLRQQRDGHCWSLLAVQPMTIGNAARLAESLRAAFEQYRGQFAVSEDNVN